MNVTSFTIGVFVGATVGFFLAALMAAAGRPD